MPKITLDISDARYAALTATAELHLPDGTPEAYLQTVVDGACDSYAQNYEPLAVQAYKERAEKAEAAAKQMAAQLIEAKAAKPEPLAEEAK